ncbi:hypothetical protein BUALT_Bualt12G0130600 [Buddleja alternifolia]|uniref:Cytochrome P450 n=1 Tax=Buddleja alternifolia TaxID=168488 RepID=A0AAV6WY58_9LAMI|nr:hypothetical protein BUALT_Bualt12G0130600 [Buddleja alternifolia]
MQFIYSSNAIEWAMTELINQPDILPRVVKELDHVVGRTRLVQESDLPKLNFVKAFAKEAFRLHPVAPVNVPHVSTKGAAMAGCFILEGSHVLLSLSGLEREPKIWKDPLRQRVEHDMSISTGRWGCAAIRLGSTMIVVLLARLIHGFTWIVSDGKSIDLVESHENMLTAELLIANATPRLNPQVYMQFLKY